MCWRLAHISQTDQEVYGPVEVLQINSSVHLHGMHADCGSEYLSEAFNPIWDHMAFHQHPLAMLTVAPGMQPWSCTSGMIAAHTPPMTFITMHLTSRLSITRQQDSVIMSQGASLGSDEEMRDPADQEEDDEMAYEEEEDDEDDDEDQEADLPSADHMSVGSMEVHDMLLGADGASPAPPAAAAEAAATATAAAKCVAPTEDMHAALRL